MSRRQLATWASCWTHCLIAASCAINFRLQMNLGQIGLNLRQFIFGGFDFLAQLPKLLSDLPELLGGSQGKRRRNVERRQFFVCLRQPLPEWQCLAQPLDMCLLPEAVFALLANRLGRIDTLVPPLAKFLVVARFDHRMAKFRSSFMDFCQ